MLPPVLAVSARPSVALPLAGDVAGRGRCGGGAGRRGHRRRRAPAPAAVPAGPGRRVDRLLRRGCSPTTRAGRPARCAGAGPAARCRRRPRRPACAAVGPPHRHPDRGPALLPDRPGSRRPRPGRRLGRRRGGRCWPTWATSRWSRHVAVTVDTAPTGGTTVRDHIAAALDPHAPALARHVLDELADHHPGHRRRDRRPGQRQPRPRPRHTATGGSARRRRRSRPVAARDRDRARRLRGRRPRPRDDRLADRADPGRVRPGRPDAPDLDATCAEAGSAAGVGRGRPGRRDRAAGTTTATTAGCR